MYPKFIEQLVSGQGTGLWIYHIFCLLCLISLWMASFWCAWVWSEFKELQSMEALFWVSELWTGIKTWLGPRRLMVSQRQEIIVSIRTVPKLCSPFYFTSMNRILRLHYLPFWHFSRRWLTIHFLLKTTLGNVGVPFTSDQTTELKSLVLPSEMEWSQVLCTHPTNGNASNRCSLQPSSGRKIFLLCHRAPEENCGHWYFPGSLI